jgi:hypothetical protein
MSKLFEEAIADAKKLKEVAEENAKKAILESVTPQIRQFIEEQLIEQDMSVSIKCGSCGHKQPYSISKDEDQVQCAGKGCETMLDVPGAVSETSGFEEQVISDDDALDEEIYLDESAMASLVNLIGKENLDSLNESKSKEALFSAVKGAVATMDDDQREKLLNLSHKINESANTLSSERGETMSRKYYEVDLRTLREALEEEETEMSESDELSELYEEFSSLLEQDEDDDGEEAGDDLPPMDDMEPLEGEEAGGAEEGAMLSSADVEAAVREMAADLGLDLGGEGDMGGDMAGMDFGDMGGLEGLEDEDADAEEDTEQLDEVFNVDPRVLRQEINRVKRLVREGKMDHHFGGKGGGKAGVDGAFGGKGKSKAGVKGAFGGGSEGKDVFVNPPQLNKLNEAIRQLRRQNRAQSEKLNKYRGAVNSLREQLEDLNLFNAKLLYVNKLLQSKSLNESQKKSVIKALDEAQSLQEAKSLYTSLTETFKRNTGTSTLNESRVMGGSSRPTTSAQSTSTSTTNELSRWQRLAGL